MLRGVEEKNEANYNLSGEGISLRPYSCDQCEKSYKYQFSLRKHIKAKHAEETEPHLNQIFSNIKCNLCQEVFKSEELKAKHFESLHMPLVRTWFARKEMQLKVRSLSAKLARRSSCLKTE